VCPPPMPNCDLRLSPISDLILRRSVCQANSEPKPARISWLDGSRNDVGSRAVELSPGKIYTSNRPAVWDFASTDAVACSGAVSEPSKSRPHLRLRLQSV